MNMSRSSEYPLVCLVILVDGTCFFVFGKCSFVRVRVCTIGVYKLTKGISRND